MQKEKLIQPISVEPIKKNSLLMYVLTGFLIVFILLSGYLVYAYTEAQKEITSLEKQIKQSQKGFSSIIEGSLGYPSDFIPSDMEVCAENAQTGKNYCTENHIKDEKYTYGKGYKVKVPPGDYFIYASLFSWENYKAYYSEFITCGLSVECLSHKPILVSVKKGDIVTDINPMDWYVVPEGGQKDETAADWKTYKNEKYKFEIKYPNSVALEDNGIGYFGSEVTEITNLVFDKDKYSLEDAYGTAYVSVQKENCDSVKCQKTHCCGYSVWDPTELADTGLADKKEINNETFYRYVTGDTDMQASYNFIEYNTFHNDSCYKLVLLLRWSSAPYKSDIANDKALIAEIETNREILNQEIPKIFTQILSTFKFID